MTTDDMRKYKLVSKIGEGTFSEVVEAQNVETGLQYAIKCMKSSFSSINEVNHLREIQALKRLSPHPNIIDLHEVLYDEPTGRLAIVFELMQFNLYDLIRGRKDPLDQSLILSLAYQTFVALDHMHSQGIFHRDIKPENILINNDASILKIADFGSCRSVHHTPPFTEYIATRWYRSPECLLTDGFYGPPMDIWGAGCVLFEIISLFPLFPGSDELDQINRIHKVVGTPNALVRKKLELKGRSEISFRFPAKRGIGIKHFIPLAPQSCVNFINKTIIYDPDERITAGKALEHHYFSEIRGSDTSVKKQSKSPTTTHSSKSPISIQKTLSKEETVTNNVSKITKPVESKIASNKIHPSDQLKKIDHSDIIKGKNSPTNDTSVSPKSTIPNKLKKPKPSLGPKMTKAATNKSSNPTMTEIRQKIAEAKAELSKSSSSTQPEKPKRSKLYANIKSSGYGGSGYKPAIARPKTSRGGNRPNMNNKPTTNNSNDSGKPARRRVNGLPNPQARKPARLPPIKT